jgi:hypothetical protein
MSAEPGGLPHSETLSRRLPPASARAGRGVPSHGVRTIGATRSWQLSGAASGAPRSDTERRDCRRFAVGRAVRGSVDTGTGLGKCSR